VDDIYRELREGVTRYANVVDQTSRTSIRARLLHLLDDLHLQREPVATRRVTGREARADSFLLGAVSVHLDLVFRTSITPEEILSTADHGLLLLAVRPDLDDLPIGVMLAQPTTGLVRHRRDLFYMPPPLAESGTMMPFALAATPPRLGAAAALFAAVMRACAELPSRPRVVTLSPMTGMRARLIRLVDDGWDAARASAGSLPGADPAVVRAQLFALLEAERLPAHIPEPSRGWLEAEAERFARSRDYAVGNFHRALGASLVGLAHGADPSDCDSLWARAYFDHGRPESRV
jgi:hypothetical protein